MHTGHSLAAKIAYISLQTVDSITAQEECPTVQFTEKKHTAAGHP